MKDFLGNELNVGDKVIWILKGGCGSVNLSIGSIYQIKRGIAYIEDLDGYKWNHGVSSVSIMKLNSNERFQTLGTKK